MFSDDFAKVWFKFTKDLKSHMESQLDSGLTEAQLYVLEHMNGQERCKTSDFTEYLATSPAAVTTLMDRMEKSGFIRRERDEKDRRIVWVLPTEKGRAVCGEGLQIRQQYMESVLNRISSHNQQLLFYLLGKVTNNPQV